MKAIPGDPFSDEKALPKEVHESLRKHYGLDDPWLVQYGNYLKAVLKGDLGPSFKYPGTSVNAIIAKGFKVSALLGLEALFLALSCGIAFGTIAALNQHKWQDVSTVGFVTLGISIPSFVIATFLQYLLALKLGWFPIARWGTLSHTVLPALALAAHPTAFIARLTRSHLLNVMTEQYIHTAKIKGLSSWKIIIKHALPPAVTPLLPYIGPLITNILVGSFVIENIFALPGLGHWFVTSVGNRDYTVIIGLTLFYSVLLLCLSFLMDLLYMTLDPRVKESRL